VAFVEARPQTVVQGEDIREFLRGRLPGYMVPKFVEIVDELPLSRNGKIDRAALVLRANSDARDLATVAVSKLEDVVLTTYREILRLDHIGLNDDFFNIGGDSLAATRLARRLADHLGLSLSAKLVFEHATARDLAAALDDLVAGADDVSSRLATPTAGRLTAGDRLIPTEDPSGGERPSDGAARSRRNSRHFSGGKVSKAQIGSLLSHMVARPRGGAMHRRYASAGGLYAVDLYLHVTDSPLRGVADIEGGLYYFDAADRGLRPTPMIEAFSREYHTPLNRPVADEASFFLMLVADIDKFANVYGDDAHRFAAVEAGMMSQLLDEAAASAGIGLCHIGGVWFDAVRRSAGLSQSQAYVHGMLGGPLEVQTAFDAEGEVEPVWEEWELS
jgi:SagB-type dehydrogenase family enzyme